MLSRSSLFTRSWNQVWPFAVIFYSGTSISLPQWSMKKAINPHTHACIHTYTWGINREDVCLSCYCLYCQVQPCKSTVSVQSLSRVRLFVTPWIAARQACLSITNSRSSPKPMSIESVMPSNHLILCHPLLLLPSIFPSIRVLMTLNIAWYNVRFCSMGFA